MLLSVSEPGDPLVGPGDPLVEPRHVKEELQGHRDMEELNHKTPQTSKTEKETFKKISVHIFCHFFLLIFS